MSGSSPKDPYSRLQYRRLIAWPGRIRREWPLLEQVLGPPPGRRVLDLGCGTGEHTRFLAEQGYEAVGVDRSEKLIEEARREAPEPVRFVVADLGAFDAVDDPALPESSFDGAICLGNTLPHLTERRAVERMFAGLRRLLLPGAPFLLQILGYERIFARGERHLPLNFRDDEDGEIVFLRLMELRDDGSVVFCPTSLRFRPDRENPVEVVSSRRVPLRGWRRGEVEEMLDTAGFPDREVFGNVEREPYVAEESRDLVLVAR